MKNFQADVELVGRISIIPSLLDVVCRTTGMGFAAVARVTEDRWIACSVKDDISFGLKPGGELKVETTICDEIRDSGEAVVIDEVRTDAMFCQHHTPAMYGFQSYISMPIIRKNGDFFGTLCAIDPKPARLKNPETIGMFKLFADLISYHLESAEQLDTSEQKLKEELKTAELREQFIAILGHDLRNPVGAISNSAQLMQRMPLDKDLITLVSVVKNSSYRALALIENILDFARGRLGGGILINNKNTCDIDNTLHNVITELRTLWPQRVIETDLKISEPVNCDSGRIAQLFSNLLANALNYGKTDEPVKVEALSAGGIFTLSVSNAGKPIPAATMDKLFTAFSRAEVKPGQQGLGLGLYIASEIARAHGGSIDATSTLAETRFTFRMPARQQQPES